MGYPTSIEWTDATWNPIGGCEIESPGCINCYAQTLAGGPRLRNHPLYAGITREVKGKSVFNGILTAMPERHKAWTWPLSWRGAKDRKLGPDRPSLIFVGDMSDLFHSRRPTADIDRVVATLLLSGHIGQLLTKRAENMAEYFTDPVMPGRIRDTINEITAANSFKGLKVCTFEHLWYGFSAERQHEMFERARHMRALAEAGLQIFVSVEPLLERLVLPTWFANAAPKPWIIVGGESGPDARPMHPDWAREIRDQCGELGLPFFFKQWGEHHWDGQLWPDGKAGMAEGDNPVATRVGKARSGRFLDGVTHDAFPDAA